MRFYKDGDAIEILWCGLLQSLLICVDGVGVARLGERNREREEEKRKKKFDGAVVAPIDVVVAPMVDLFIPYLW